MFHICQVISPKTIEYCQVHRYERYCKIVNKYIPPLEKREFYVDPYIKYRCEKLRKYTDYASNRLYGTDIYSPLLLALFTQESSCRWETSRDGWGSIGYAQLTPRFEGWLLNPVVPQWKYVVKDYVYAAMYVLKYNERRFDPYKKWWINLQIYNGGTGVVYECRDAHSSKWGKCLFHCQKNPYICVWRSGGRCLQYRDGCDINYQYSTDIFRYYMSYKDKNQREIKNFW